MTFNADFIPTQGDDVAALITQMLQSSPALALAAAKKTSDKMNSIIRRAIGKTGSTIRFYLADGLKKGKLNIKPRQRYTKTDISMSSLMKQVRPWKLGSYTKLFLKMLGKSEKPVGHAYGGMMEYRIQDETDNGQTLEIGMIQGGRATAKWKDRFAEWQEAGSVDIMNYNLDSMQGYLGGLGIPIKDGTDLDRPERPVIENARKENDPVQMFSKFFEERLLG